MLHCYIQRSNTEVTILFSGDIWTHRMGLPEDPEGTSRTILLSYGLVQ